MNLKKLGGGRTRKAESPVARRIYVTWHVRSYIRAFCSPYERNEASCEKFA